MVKETIVEARQEFFETIGQLARFAAASDYIYDHFTITADELKNEKLPHLTKLVKVEEVITSIIDRSVSVMLYENVIVRAYGILEVFVAKVVTAIIREAPEKFIKNTKIDLSDIFEGDVEKLKEGHIEKAIIDATSNKNMYSCIENVFYKVGIDLSKIGTSEKLIKDIYLLRNLIVHRNCITDKKFLENHSQSNGWNLGEKLICEHKTMSSSVNSLCAFVRKVSDSFLK